ncbi:MAG TPA: hypothetical protein VMA36_13705 [Candidatus Limnocylindria bacterium]|jgi:hypothetical protein|nr:hypothetical protein [Candidatus Limnocylindria bacterium]
MAKRPHRIQVDIRGYEEQFERARALLNTESDSETGRALLAMFERIATALESGTTVSFAPPDDVRFVDAFPDVTRRALYGPAARYLVLASPHRWDPLVRGREISASDVWRAHQDARGDLDRTAASVGLAREAVDAIVGYVRAHAVLVERERAARGAPSGLDPARRGYGMDAGLFRLPEDFDEPLPDDVLGRFEQ